MAIVSKPQYFLGTVVGISKDDNKKLKNEREFHEIIVDIPGVIQNVKAYPRMGELDEPKIGDQVLLLSLDPEYNSYFLYEKLKESDFIGFRASGKMVDITPKYITVGVFDEGLTNYGNEEHWNGNKNGEGKIKDNQITSVTIDNEGNITVEAAKNRGKGNLNVYLKGNTDITIDGDKGNNITISKDSNVEIKGKSNIKVSGNCNIEASGNCTIKSPSVKITGGQLTVSGVVNPPGGIPNPMGPFCGIPNCLFTGAPHADKIVRNT